MVKSGDPGSDFWAGGCRSGATANQNYKCEVSTNKNPTGKDFAGGKSPPAGYWFCRRGP